LTFFTSDRKEQAGVKGTLSLIFRYVYRYFQKPKESGTEGTPKRMRFSFVENHSTSFLKVLKVCSAADGQDGSGLQLETSSLVFWKKTVKTDYGFFLQ